LLYATVSASPPDLITIAPRLSLKVTLGSSVPSEGRSYLEVEPSSFDYVFQTLVVRGDGQEEVVSKSFDQCNFYPLRHIEGDVFFKVLKKPTQRVLSCRLVVQ
jgi:hypothetical protein